MIESMWSQYKPPVSPTNLNLDDMFSFLLEDKKDIHIETQEALDQINKQFTELDELLTQDMVRT